VTVFIFNDEAQTLSLDTDELIANFHNIKILLLNISALFLAIPDTTVDLRVRVGAGKYKARKTRYHWQ